MKEMLLGPVGLKIQAELTGHLSPVYLEVENESFKHRGGPDAETHFKVLVVSDQFTGQSRIQRHRTVHELLRQVLEGPVHALSLRALDPLEWQTSGEQTFRSPPCAGKNH